VWFAPNGTPEREKLTAPGEREVNGTRREREELTAPGERGVNGTPEREELTAPGERGVEIKRTRPAN
jgi:hypothetical protein